MRYIILHLFHEMKRTCILLGGVVAMKKYIENELLKAYPKKKYKTLGKIKDENSKLYNKIVELANAEDKTPRLLLKELGYSKQKRRTTPKESKNDYANYYDVEFLRKIRKEYDVTLADIGEVLGPKTPLSRERVRQIIDGDVAHYDKWGPFILDEEKFEFLEENLFKKRNVFYEADGIKIRIISNMRRIIKGENDLTLKLMLIANRNGRITYSTDFIASSPYYNKIYEYGYFLFDYVTNNNYIKKSYETAVFIKNSLRENRIYSIDSGVKREINTIIKNSLLDNMEDYFAFFALDERVNYKDKRFAPEDRFHKRLDKYVNSEGELRLLFNADYQYIANQASRNGVTVAEFLEDLGYNYVTNTENRINEIKEKIELRLISKDEVYIDTTDPFYHQLIKYAERREKEIGQFIYENFGYKRVFWRDITDKSLIYNWTQEYVDLQNFDENKIKQILLRLTDEDNILQLESNSNLYFKLNIFAKSKGTKPTELLTKWGIKYEFIRKTPNTPGSNVHEETVEDKNVSIIEKLDELLTEVKFTGDTIKKYDRNQTLVRELKKLYDYECQLCHPEEAIPKIVKADGTKYIEMHHIIPVSSIQQSDVNDESNVLIDDYKNCLVLCPHHHKVLHFQNGGYMEVEKNNEELYLINQQDDSKIKIYKNLHL